MNKQQGEFEPGLQQLLDLFANQASWLFPTFAITECAITIISL